MAYTDPGAVSASSTGTSTWANAVRASIIVTAPAVAAAEGDLFIATAANTIAALTVGATGQYLTVKAGRPAWQTIYLCSVYHDADQEMANGSWTSVAFNSERSDTSGMHDPTTNNSRVTIIADASGWYDIDANITVEDNGDQAVRILLNGTTEIARVREFYDTGSGPANVSHSLHRTYYLSAADYIEVQVMPTAGSSTADCLALGNYSPELTVSWRRV